uniref:Serine/threonine-protein phosphatase 2A activator n=1 Tax=Caligus clemensi TaxID=344056 RepID=C1C042_CALCM|nr:Serine/threonine-protein phosphatase 2A regulatory subunit B [Caligus clemensi]
MALESDPLLKHIPGCPFASDYVVPQKEVKSIEDVKRWENSEAYQEYLGFIIHIGDRIQNKKISNAGVPGKATSLLMDILSTLNEWIDEIPLEDQGQRFGNKSFRVWCARLKDRALDLLDPLIPIETARNEALVYFVHSFGDATRIDYGTGHEMSFIQFLCSLFRIGVFGDSDKEFVGLKLFQNYMNLSRRLQRHYMLEPAGSQGVWSLDDYQFVAFIWGAAQLIGNRAVKPKSISNYELAEALAEDYHLFACIHYISTVKTGPFAEHSNQLWNISAVPTWEKINSGLIKMYKAEVLSKFPVIQHVYFGSIFNLKLHPPPTKV